MTIHLEKQLEIAGERRTECRSGFSYSYIYQHWQGIRTLINMSLSLFYFSLGKLTEDYKIPLGFIILSFAFLLSFSSKPNNPKAFLFDRLWGAGVGRRGNIFSIMYLLIQISTFLPFMLLHLLALISLETFHSSVCVCERERENESSFQLFHWLLLWGLFSFLGLLVTMCAGRDMALSCSWAGMILEIS